MSEQDDELPATGNEDYDKLPVSIRQMYGLKQYLWLSDAEKASLVTRETEPEWEE